jgi:hypothetical protein
VFIRGLFVFDGPQKGTFNFSGAGALGKAKPSIPKSRKSPFATPFASSLLASRALASLEKAKSRWDTQLSSLNGSGTMQGKR